MVMRATKKLRLINVIMKNAVAEPAKPYIPQRFQFQMARTHTKFTRLKKPKGRIAQSG
jgi:hypothetical protein